MEGQKSRGHEVREEGGREERGRREGGERREGGGRRSEGRGRGEQDERCYRRRFYCSILIC